MPIRVDKEEYFMEEKRKIIFRISGYTFRGLFISALIAILFIIIAIPVGQSYVKGDHTHVGVTIVLFGLAVITVIILSGTISGFIFGIIKVSRSPGGFKNIYPLLTVILPILFITIAVILFIAWSIINSGFHFQ